MKRGIKYISAAWLLIMLLIIPVFSVSAAQPTAESYAYDEAGQAHPAPAGYAVDQVLLPNHMGLASWGNVTDLAVDRAGNLYLLCPDEGMIRKVDPDFSAVTAIVLTDENGTVDFSGAAGFCISEYSDGFSFYIADGSHARVLKADSSGRIEREYGRPDTTLIDEKTEFIPLKVTVNESGFLFIICNGIYSGAVVLNREGDFISFYGSNQIKLSATVLYDYMWKKIFGSARSGTMSRYVPVEFSNLAINEKGFIYTVTASDAESAGLRLINFNSNDILADADYGDLEVMTAVGEELSSSFTDIAYLGQNIVAVLDSSRNRVFVYNDEGELLTVFGGIGYSAGMFAQPTAIECYEDQIFVFDAGADAVTVFQPTEYGKTLLAASRMYMNGNYDESLVLWESVLRQNNGFHTAYVSIGRSLLSINDYEGAMRYFRLGGAQSDYSEALAQQRKVVLKKWFLPIFVLLILGVAALFWLMSDKRRAKLRARTGRSGAGIAAVMFHPITGYPVLLQKKRLIWLFPAVLTGWFVLNIAVNEYSGFAFHNKSADPLDLRVEFIATVAAGLAFVAANWLIVTMTEGNGSLKQIACVFAVSILPYLGGRLLYIPLSNVLVLEESTFANAPVVIGFLWAAVLLLTGLMKIHEFTFSDAVVNVLLTLLGIAAIAFILLLEISIIKQIQVLIATVMDEIVAMTQ